MQKFTYDNLKYLTDQVLGYLSLYNDKEFFESFRKHNISGGIGYLCTREFKSKHPKPDGFSINCSALVTNPTADLKTKIFFQLRIRHKKNYKQKILSTSIENTPIKITIRPVTVIEGLSESDKGYKGYARSVISQQLGYENLVIADHKEPDFWRLLLQLGVYLYQQKILTQIMVSDVKGSVQEDICLYGAYRKILGDLNAPLEKPDFKLFERVLKSFTIPSDAKSFETYLKLIIKELRDGEFRRMERFGVNVQTIYSLNKSGKIDLPKAGGRYDYADESFIKQLEQYKKNKEINKDLAELYSSKKNVTLDSAKRTIRRWIEKGLNSEEMYHKIFK